jgi:hypothetical protein
MLVLDVVDDQIMYVKVTSIARARTWPRRAALLSVFTITGFVLQPAQSWAGFVLAVRLRRTSR